MSSKQPSVRRFDEDGFITVTYPETLRRAVKKAEDSWKAFCSLSDDVKAGLLYSNNGAGVGYEKKGVSAPGSPSKDPKENFDVTLGGLVWLEENAARVGEPVVLQFIHDAAAVVTELKPLVLEFAAQVEAAYQLPDFVKEVEKSVDRFFVRFIHYFGGQKPGTITAEAHPDQSAFTPHLFESAPGLQCLTFDGRWIDMPVSEGETVIIPSMQLQYRSKCALKALIHRVIANEDTAANGRYSAVCFIQLADTAKYDKDGYGRLQERQTAFVKENGEGGFNYQMPFSVFGKMFK